MWIVIARAPRPDAPQWAGRCGWAALDAIVWPSAWIAGVFHVPGHGGILGAFAVATASLAAFARLYRAVWNNERYYFTTWRWGRVLLMVLAWGWALKLAVMALGR